MHIQYKVNVSENQVDTSKDAVRLKKGVTRCFPKGGMEYSKAMSLDLHLIQNTRIQMVHLFTPIRYYD